ncbi:fam-c protein [Plasmodium vinckei lentum]|uniref:Fam-c protein n=1 Tax=Plasmodium vinckei lentum TaxID=138297 RepID=A0A6V7RW79_PLAVN|nr:fam-c protein [Plasmodium vinckei lentum]
MNKSIFSLVCIILYALLAASIHCADLIEYEIKRKTKRAIKELLKRNEEDEARLKREARLKNGGIIDHLDAKDYEDISYHNEYINDNMHTRVYVNYDKEYNREDDKDGKDAKDSTYAKVLKCFNIFKGCKKKHSKFLYKLSKELSKQPSKLKPSNNLRLIITFK